MTNLKPLTQQLKDIKNTIKDFKDSRTYAKGEEKEIIKRYAQQLAQYDHNSWMDKSVIDTLTKQRDSAIYNMYDTFGNDATIHIIYIDGSQCIASGTEIVTGEITPKLQHIAYASYQDGYTEYDTLTGSLEDKWNLENDEDFEAREEYFNNVEIMFNTEWGKKHKVM